MKQALGTYSQIKDSTEHVVDPRENRVLRYDDSKKLIELREERQNDNRTGRTRREKREPSRKSEPREQFEFVKNL